jgi:hypothetical protein
MGDLFAGVEESAEHGDVGVDLEGGLDGMTAGTEMTYWSGSFCFAVIDDILCSDGSDDLDQLVLLFSVGKVSDQRRLARLSALSSIVLTECSMKASILVDTAGTRFAESGHPCSCYRCTR